MKKLLLMALLVAPFVAVNAEQAKGKKKGEKGSVSYTHLTLPTILRV